MSILAPITIPEKFYDAVNARYVTFSEEDKSEIWKIWAEREDKLSTNFNSVNDYWQALIIGDFLRKKDEEEKNRAQSEKEAFKDRVLEVLRPELEKLRNTNLKPNKLYMWDMSNMPETATLDIPFPSSAKKNTISKKG